MEDSCQCDNSSILIVHTHDYFLFQNPLGAVIEHCRIKYGEGAKILVADFTSITSEYSFGKHQRTVQHTRPLEFHEKERHVKVLSFSSHAPRLEEPIHTREQSIHSELHSFFLSDSIPKNLLAKLYERRLRKIYDSVYSHIIELCKNQHFCAGYSLNGRHPPGAAAAAAMLSSGVRRFFWELGEGKNAAYICDHEPQNHAAILREFETLEVTDAERAQARKWVTARASSKSPRESTNSLRSPWPFPQESRESEDKEKRDIVFFSSSKDEFWSLGSLFPSKIWQSQYEGLSSLLSVLGDEIGSLTVRLHPNLKNKSLRLVIDEICEVRDLLETYSAQIIWPHDRVNSYDLAFKSDLVVVANSTIGPELALMGKKVIHLENSVYAATAKASLYSPNVSASDLRTLLSTKTLQSFAEKEIALKIRHKSHFASCGLLYTSASSRLGQIRKLNGIWALFRSVVQKRNRILSEAYLRIISVWLRE